MNENVDIKSERALDYPTLRMKEEKNDLNPENRIGEVKRSNGKSHVYEPWYINHLWTFIMNFSYDVNAHETLSSPLFGIIHIKYKLSFVTSTRIW